MGAPLPLSVLRQQPQQAPQLDISNPITRGLSVVQTGAHNGPFNTVNGPGVIGTSVGLARTLNPASSQYLIADNVGVSTTSLTFLSLATVFSTAQSNFVTVGNGSTSDRVTLYSAGGALALFCGQGNGGYGQAMAGSNIPLGVPNTLIGRVSSATKRDVWQNGVLLKSDTASSTPAAASKIVIGADYNAGALSGYMNGQFALVLVWNRPLSDAEIVSISANPWQVFKGQSSLERAVMAAIASVAPPATAAALTGAAAARATATGTLTTAIRLNGSAVAQTSVSGTLSTAIRLAGGAAAQSSASGSLAGGAAALAGAATARASVSGALSTAIVLSGGAASRVSATGVLAGGAAALSGAAAARAAAGGVLSTSIALSGTAVVQSAAAGNIAALGAGVIDVSKISSARIVVFEGSGSRVTPFESSGSRVTPFDSSGSRVTPFEGSGGKTVRFE